jgi:hypothetical protein
VLDRLVVALRVPVVLLLSGRSGAAGDPATRDPIASGAGLGDVALSLRAVLLDDALFAVALQAEASMPTAEAIAPSQDLAGEAGVSFTPELAGELRFSPVRITANLGARFRQPAAYQTLRVEHELTWAAGVGVDIVPDVLDATIEGYGATPLTRFATASLSPVELLLGVRVRPIRELVIGLAGGPGLGDGYGAPVFRGVLTVGLLALPESSPDVVDAVEDEVPPSDEHEPDTAGTEETTETTTAVGAGGIDPIEAPPPEPAELRTAIEPFSRDDYGQLDRDGDRIVDAEDQRVLDREDYDEIEDADGCPEDNADGDPVPDVDDVCPSRRVWRTRTRPSAAAPRVPTSASAAPS